MIIKEEVSEAELRHYGTPRKSGRYPWGSGGDPYQNSSSFLAYVDEMLGKGMTEPQVAEALGISTTKLRAQKSIAKNEQKQADIGMAQRLHDKGYSNIKIGIRMERNESSVRALLAPGAKDKADMLMATSNMLKESVDNKGFIDVGTGVEYHIGVSRNKLDTAIEVLKEQGYSLESIQVDQLGTKNKTTVKVLAPPGTTYRDIVMNKGAIKQINEFSEDHGRTWLGIQPPLNVSSSRVGIRYAEQGGKDSDGVILVRPGVDDVSLGKSRYAQVRVAVDGTHYIKGMAMYGDDLPKGVDLLFNTNKSNTGNKLDALKPMKTDKDGVIDPDNPFGAVIKPGGQRIIKGLDGKDQVISVMNLVNEEGDWDKWSRNLSSQMLSKQPAKLAKTQLSKKLESKKADLKEINSLTNAAVRKKLLESYADAADSSAVHLRAAPIPNQRNQVILPINSMKDTEIYAPNFSNGDRVALIRYPHGGTFEIPELTVNNNVRRAKSILGNASDAVGINSKVAERLSGADFDGDTVVVIPNNSGRIKSTPALAALKHFDPQHEYPAYEGMTFEGNTQNLMGSVSNLITDMTIKGATTSELSRAVRHSMVVIDAEKHNLNYKQAAKDLGINALKKKYQGGANRGASTIISKSGSAVRVRDRKPRADSRGGPVDPKTGKLVYEYSDEHWVTPKGKTKYKENRSTKMFEADNAHTLSSGQPIEKIYADHANGLKALANSARKSAVNTKPVRYSPSAKRTYAAEVDSLDASLRLALRNKPLERQAQIVAGTQVEIKRKANPNMDPSDLKKIRGAALEEARRRTGAGKELVKISPREWEAIQSGAISNKKLTDILDNTDLDRVKELATPKSTPVFSSAKRSRALAMLAGGATQAEVAAALGVSVSTISKALND